MTHRRSVLNISILILAFFSLTTFASIPTSGLVGSTNGSFAVGPDGAAGYDIPIQLPPNVGGIQPSLSLSYNSGGGNGLLGMGWQLGGLSAISRCPNSKLRDRILDGVDFDGNDKYCLDGQRLVSIGGNVFRTEIDGFSQITGDAYGFTVTTPSGQVM